MSSELCNTKYSKFKIRDSTIYILKCYIPKICIITKLFSLYITSNVLQLWSTKQKRHEKGCCCVNHISSANVSLILTNKLWFTNVNDRRMLTCEYPWGLRVKPDMLVSIHGLAPGSCLNFRKTNNILDGLHKRVIVTHGSVKMSCLLYFHATR